MFLDDPGAIIHKICLDVTFLLLASESRSIDIFYRNRRKRPGNILFFFFGGEIPKIYMEYKPTAVIDSFVKIAFVFKSPRARRARRESVFADVPLKRSKNRIGVAIDRPACVVSLFSQRTNGLRFFLAVDGEKKKEKTNNNNSGGSSDWATVVARVRAARKFHTSSNADARPHKVQRQYQQQCFNRVNRRCTYSCHFHNTIYAHRSAPLAAPTPR